MWTKLNVLIEIAEKAKKKEVRQTAYRHRSSNNYLSILKNCPAKTQPFYPKFKVIILAVFNAV